MTPSPQEKASTDGDGCFIGAMIFVLLSLFGGCWSRDSRVPNLEKRIQVLEEKLNVKQP